MRLEVMTWKQAERYFQTHDMAVLPIGSIENHGSHLALGTDFLVPSKIAEQLDRESDVLILPAVPYGVADHHCGFPGTISIGYDGLYCIVSKIVEKLYGYGVRRFIFLNGHGGNNPVLQHIGIDLNGRGAVSAIVNWWQIAGQLNPDWKGGHGGAEETAAMLAIDPDCVHMEDYIPLQPQNLSDTLRCAGMSEVELDGVAVMTPRLFRNLSPGGWYGPDDPKCATAQWGEQMLDACGKFILRFLAEFQKVKLPQTKAKKERK